MRPRRSPRDLSERARKDKRRAKRPLGTGNRPRTSKDTAHVDVKLKVWSPTKAEKWLPRGISPESSQSYTLDVANAHDLDKQFLEAHYESMREDMDSDSEDFSFEESSSELEDLIPDWEEYVDPFSEFKWMEEITGTATYQESKHSSVEEIAWCRAHLIRRWEIADSFWEDMEEPEHETAELAFELFDRFGCLKSEFMEHPVKRGSGVWGDELNKGDMLLIETLTVSTTHRRRGIGSQLARAIIELASRMSKNFIIFTWPGISEDQVSDEAAGRPSVDDNALRQELHDIAHLFWRRLNFRRIGSSRWLGYSPDSEHPSRCLPVDRDFDLAPFMPVAVSQDLEDFMKSVPTLEDSECLSQLRQLFGDAPFDDLRWEATNRVGDTLLHLLSCSCKVQSIKYLMHRRPSLLSRRNKYGNSPLEALEASMERNRTIQEYGFKRTDVSDRFGGFDHPTIASLALLKGFDLDQMPEPQRRRLTFGCTCGSCLGGFLSPRMREMLVSSAEETYDLIYTFDDGRDGDSWSSCHSHLFDYLPEPIALGFVVDKVSRTGFCMLWKHIAICMNKNLLPTEENVLFLIRNAGEYPPYSREFIQKGGSISSVATMLFERTMHLERDYGLGIRDPTDDTDLPACRNDREFGMVSGMCGYERITRVRHLTMQGKKIRD